jgi:membrane associated rhomboid family serine protease
VNRSKAEFAEGKLSRPDNYRERQQLFSLIIGAKKLFVLHKKLLANSYILYANLPIFKSMDDEKNDKKRLLLSMVFPLLFVMFLWLIKLVEITAGIQFSVYGLYPLKAEGLLGIITGPLIHGDWHHLINNTFPLFILSWAIFYFYHEIAWKVFVLVYLLSQFWLWFFAREAYHIGASGLIYGFGAFVFVSGIIRRNKNLLAISLLVAFLYGSMVWGIFPLKAHISWEGHLMGMIAGTILAFYYKDFGPPLLSQIIDDDEEDYLPEEFDYSDTEKE